MHAPMFNLVAMLNGYHRFSPLSIIPAIFHLQPFLSRFHLRFAQRLSCSQCFHNSKSRFLANTTACNNSDLTKPIDLPNATESSASLKPLHISVRIQHQDLEQLCVCILQHLRVRSNAIPLASDLSDWPPPLIIAVHLSLGYSSYDPAGHGHDLAEQLSCRVGRIVEPDISWVAAGLCEKLSNGLEHDD